MPNPLLYVLNSCLWCIRAISLRHVTHSENGYWVHTNHEFLPPEPFLHFSQRNAQSTTLGPKLMFVVLSCNFVAARHPFRKRVLGAYKSRVFATGTIFRFSQRTCPLHYFRSKTHVWVVFAQFRCSTSPIPKTGIGVHTKHEFLPPEPFLRFSQRTCPIH
jgi:hypothetical protein